ncbi:Uncharacterised protein [Actinobacillus equuli]|nr:Uncharacterised protein [Actinobacillus equuli]
MQLYAIQVLQILLKSDRLYRTRKIQNLRNRYKNLVRQLNNIEQCLFPDLAKPNYQQIYDNWSVAESMTMLYFQQNLLKELIGEQNAQFIEKDEPSRLYFEQMHENTITKS